MSVSVSELALSVIISFRWDYVCDEASWRHSRALDPDSQGSLSSKWLPYKMVQGPTTTSAQILLALEGPLLSWCPGDGLRGLTSSLPQ